jgi:hypothetical protein
LCPLKRVSVATASHTKWAAITAFWMFCPFLIQLGAFMFKWLLHLLGKQPSPGPFTSVLLHIPFVMTLRSVTLAQRLHQLGITSDPYSTNSSKNAEERETILKRAGIASLHESFFEAGPQAVTQLVIFLCTGNISYAQCFSVCSSLVSLTWGASRAYFIQRQKDLVDPHPDTMLVAIRVFPLMFIVVINSLLMWIFIGGLFMQFVFVPICITFMFVYIALLVLIRVKTIIKNEQTEMINTCESAIPNPTYLYLDEFRPGLNLEGDKNEVQDEKEYFKQKAAACSVWLHCVVGDHHRMFLISALTGLTAKVFLLALGFILALKFDLTQIVHPFLPYCHPYNASREHINETLITFCKFSRNTFIFNTINTCDINTDNIGMDNSTIDFIDNLEICFSLSDSEINQKLRICEPVCFETQIHIYFIIGLSISTILAVMATYRLNQIASYAKLFEATKSLYWIIPTTPYIHRSFLFTLVKNGDHDKLENVLNTQPDDVKKKLLVNKPDRNGETPLHFACESGFTLCAEILKAHGAVIMTNSRGLKPACFQPGIKHIIENRNLASAVIMRGEVDNEEMENRVKYAMTTGGACIPFNEIQKQGLHPSELVDRIKEWNEKHDHGAKCKYLLHMLA